MDSLLSCRNPPVRTYRSQHYHQRKQVDGSLKFPAARVPSDHYSISNHHAQLQTSHCVLPLWRWRPTIVSHGRRSRPPATLYRMQVIFKRESGYHTTLACLSRPTRHDLRRTDHTVLRCPRLHPWTRQWSQSVMRKCLRSTPNYAHSCSSRCAFD